MTHERIEVFGAPSRPSWGGPSGGLECDTCHRVERKGFREAARTLGIRLAEACLEVLDCARAQSSNFRELRLCQASSQTMLAQQHCQ
jgi:hypothetical protein